MRRLFFLLPDVESCKLLVDELKQYGIPERHLHAIASLEVSLEGLPQATDWEKTEVKHGLEWGIGLGGMAGLLGGLMAVAFPVGGLVVGGGALALGAAAGAGFGGIVSALMKSEEHNHDLDEYKEEIEAGEILLMVDVPREYMEEVREMILARHPEVHIHVTPIPRNANA